MAYSPPTSPPSHPPRPVSAIVRPPRSHSRMSTSSKHGGSRASDDDSKTSVKVAVRIRPPLKPTDPGFELIPQRFQRSMVQVTSPTGLAVDSPQGRKLFVFDRVFGENVDQEGVWDYVSESVNSFVQGYNVSVLAYGQSGAGKSFTMGTSGPAEQGNLRLMGVIPRAAAALFEKLGTSPAAGRGGTGMRTPNRYSTSTQTLQTFARGGNEKSWQMVATYVEIYNEQLRDLLVPDSVPMGERSAVVIREDKGRILLTGLHQVTINSIDDLLRALNFGSTIRQTDATAINAKSSRSHAVFSLNLVQRKPRETPLREKRLSVPVDNLGTMDMVTIDSKLHFVDLAGSERLKNTGASGERAKEGISINAGLASLGKVISQLSSRQVGAHVSYRDSRLTRLLQDSLGGNAITYMIACVTPAEFHLSETLNTIQYAQRARAIQSKPSIQQISEEGDKQALIDRLRAEVSFLREQINNVERSDRIGTSPLEKSERQNEREIELQNHLLDIQENYSALSQRHAKLIAEIAKVREGASDEPASLPAAVGGESVMERLKRSNSFADAVEQVVLEYEKTIQSLETSLSNTRSSLATTESNLLERETKYAYIETVNHQLQSRVQKLIDRESSTEQYLHDLEAKLDGRSVGDERTSAAMTDLRKEISRMRENETTCEEYISTLEERLAEGDQDMELMQREIARLEHVVERQRSLGKLDNLLYELDHIQANGKDDAPQTNGETKKQSGTGRRRGVSAAVLKVAVETPIPESDEDTEDALTPSVTPEPLNHQFLEPYSPAQSKFVAEKLDTVNQELFDLRVEHESTVNEYELLATKYEEAIRTLATLREAIDESRRPVVPSIPSSPTYFLEDARVKALKNAGQSSSSRSLSSELSSVGELSNIRDDFDADPAVDVSASRDSSHDIQNGGAAGKDGLSSQLTNAETSRTALQAKYEKLEEEHLDALDLVEELKAEIVRQKLSAPLSPTSPVIRRKSSQNVMSIDRAHRSLASLGNLATENFEDRPDVKQNFELNLAAVMHELHQRSERVEVLEAELAGVKKEMENKMTIISGLTRERTTMKSSSPVDMSVISSIRDQMVQSEVRLKTLHQDAAAREMEMAKEIEMLKRTVPPVPAREPEANKEQHAQERELQEQKLRGLQADLLEWQAKHKAAVDSIQTSEQRMLSTVTELEASLNQVQRLYDVKSAELATQANSMAAATVAFELECSKHAATVESLNREIDDHKSTVDSHVGKILELQQAHDTARREMEEGRRFKQTALKDLNAHRDQIEDLGQQLQEYRSSLEFHQHSIKSLRDSHAQELEDMHGAVMKEAEADAAARFDELSSQHEREIAKHQDIMRGLELQLQDHEATIDAHRRELGAREQRVRELEQQIQRTGASNGKEESAMKETMMNLKMAEDARATAEASLILSQAKIEELTWAKTELNEELDDLREKEGRARRLVDDLEGQLHSTFETSQAATSRLSLMQTTRDSELQEARAAHHKAQEEIVALNGRVEQLESQRSSTMLHPSPTPDSQPNGSERTASMSSIRKSGSVQSLPSPPPAIPLPPLPGLASPNPSNSSHRPTSPAKDASLQRIEEQEARIKTIEKHLFAEKQLTATLEEALVDLETQGNKVKNEVEAWKKKAWAYEDELGVLKKERNLNRHSLQAVEEERSARKEAEAARAHLEERMAALNKKKKKSTLNCF